MAKKHTEEDVARMCAERGHTYVGGYVGADKHFNCVCSCGAPWTVFLCTVRRNKGCMQCAKHSEKAIATICAEHGHAYVGGYTNADNTFNCICSCGKPWTTMLGTIRQGSSCHGQLTKVIPHKHTESSVAEICARHGHTYINGWKNAQTKFGCICSCGRPWLVLLGSIHRGHSCRECSGAVKLNPEAVAKELASYELILLKPYINSAIKLTYQCTCGNIGNTTLAWLRRGARCGKCGLAEKKWRSFFSKYNCEIIDYRSACSIDYICACGELNTIQANNFAVTDKMCPKCRLRRDYKSPNPPTSRKGLYAWKRRVVTRDAFECQLCNAEIGLEIHHIEAYSRRFDLIEDDANGITLCHDCHKFLHSRYGHQVGRENLEKELLNVH